MMTYMPWLLLLPQFSSHNGGLQEAQRNKSMVAPPGTRSVYLCPGPVSRIIIVHNNFNKHGALSGSCGPCHNKVSVY